MIGDVGVNQVRRVTFSPEVMRQAAAFEAIRNRNGDMRVITDVDAGTYIIASPRDDGDGTATSRVAETMANTLAGHDMDNSSEAIDAVQDAFAEANASLEGLGSGVGVAAVQLHPKRLGKALDGAYGVAGLGAIYHYRQVGRLGRRSFELDTVYSKADGVNNSLTGDEPAHEKAEVGNLKLKRGDWLLAVSEDPRHQQGTEGQNEVASAVATGVDGQAVVDAVVAGGHEHGRAAILIQYEKKRRSLRRPLAATGIAGASAGAAAASAGAQGRHKRTATGAVPGTDPYATDTGNARRRGRSTSGIPRQRRGSTATGAAAGVAAGSLLGRTKASWDRGRTERSLRRSERDDRRMAGWSQERRDRVQSRGKLRKALLGAGLLIGVIASLDPGEGRNNDKGLDLLTVPFDTGDRTDGTGIGADIDPLNFVEWWGNDDPARTDVVPRTNTFDPSPTWLDGDPMSFGHRTVTFSWATGFDLEAPSISVDTPDIPGVPPVDVPDVPPVVPPAVPGDQAPQVPGDFTIESGRTLPGEIEDFARAIGASISAERAYDLHEQARAKFGDDYIDLIGQDKDVYVTNGDVRIAGQGEARWASPEVAAFFRSQILAGEGAPAGETPSGGQAEQRFEPGAIISTGGDIPAGVETFVIEQGNGYTQELDDYLDTVGTEKSDAWLLGMHQELTKKFGVDYLRGVSKYGLPADITANVGLGSTGQAAWAPGVEDYINAALESGWQPGDAPVSRDLWGYGRHAAGR